MTFLPMDEVKRLGSLKDAAINEAKVILAYEVTKLIHGEDEANKAKAAAEALFEKGSNLDDVPTVEITKDSLDTPLIDVLTFAKVFASKSEGRRLIQQGGLRVNDEKITAIDFAVTTDIFDEEKSALVRKGKKKYYRLILK